MNKNKDKIMGKNIKELGKGEEIERCTPQILEKLLIIWKETANEQRIQQFIFNLNENFTKEVLKGDYRFVDKQNNQ